MLDLGDTVHIGGTCRDAAGSPTNAATVQLTVRLPDGTDQVVAVTNPPAVTGEYGVDYVPATAGLYRWWLRTTIPGTALTGSFDVRDPFPPVLISIAAAKEHLNIVGAAHDEELRGFVEAVTEVLEDHVGRVLVRRAFTEYRHVDRHVDRLALGRVPALSLTSVARVDATQTWSTTTDLHLDGESGVVTVRTGRPPLQGHLQIGYVAGLESPPARYTLAARAMVAGLWEFSQRAGRSRRPSPDETRTEARRLLPADVAELLGDPPGGFA